MEKEKIVVLQLWEESEKGWGVRPDGCSLHTDVIECQNHIKSIYNSRSKEVPSEYSRVCGKPLYVHVSDTLYNLVQKDKTVVLLENSLTNLKDLSEIIYLEPILAG
jgi:hypothetical protein